VGDHVILRVKLSKSSLKFCSYARLAPRFCRLSIELERIELVALCI
jgi:hypothetical protein